MKNNLYMPVLKWKAGEQEALLNLDDSIKDSLIPLVEIMDIPGTRKKIPTIEQYLAEVVTDIAECWGKNPVFIDIYDLDETVITKDGSHFLYFLFEKLIEEGIQAIPVLSFSRGNSYTNAAIDICFKYKIGLCVRVTTEYISDVKELLYSLQQETGIEDNQLSLILDFGYFDAKQINTIVLGADAAIRTIENINKLNYFAISGTGFPESISDIERHSVGEIDRTEWLCWKKLKKKEHSISRMPIYGDYTITHPIPIEFDPVTMTIGGKIKYTSEEKFIIFKGSSLKKDGYDQMHSIAKAVINHPAYMGESFSWGDKHIAKCARLETTPGNPKTWVTVGINHHIAFVAYQLSNLNDS